MAEARSAEHTPDSPKSQADYHAHAPKNVVQLLDLREIEELWGFTEHRIYRAATEGRIHAYGRPGRQKYYSRAELVAVFGEPRYPKGSNSGRQARNAKGGNQQSFDLRIAEAA